MHQCVGLYLSSRHTPLDIGLQSMLRCLSWEFRQHRRLYRAAVSPIL